MAGNNNSKTTNNKKRTSPAKGRAPQSARKHASTAKSRSSNSSTKRTATTKPRSSGSTQKHASTAKSRGSNSSTKRTATTKPRSSGSTQKHASTTRRKSTPTRARRRTSRIIKLIILLIGINAIAGISLLHKYTTPERISDGGFTHANRFSDCIVVDGIDVSYAQASISKWKKVKNSGVDFVIIRAGYRDSTHGKLHEDEYFKRNIEGAHKAGLMVGVYIFSQAKNEKEARAEAEYLIELVDGYDIDLPLVLDYESVPGGRLEKALNSGKISRKKANKIALAFSDTVEAAGYESMVYANTNYMYNVFDGHKLAKFTSIWLAQFNSKATYDGEYSIWQCSDSSKVPGIKHAVDKDFLYLNPDKVYTTQGARNKNALSISECRVELADHSSTYIGAAVEPGARVYDGHTELKEGTDYKVSYVHNTSAGTGYMIVTGLGSYKDTVITSFRIKALLKDSSDDSSEGN